jgi:hypothetical protein
VKLDAATVFLQWGAGGLAFLWLTTRHRIVSLGYGWLLRGVFGTFAVLAALLETRSEHAGAAHVTFMVGAIGMALAAAVALTVSVVRRGAGVSAGAAEQARRRERVAAMVAGPDGDVRDAHAPGDAPSSAKEFPPALDIPAPLFGAIGLLGAAGFVGGSGALALLRLFTGAALLGSVSDAMLLGHWYLTQPGLSREPLRELVRATAIVWPIELVALLLAPGMLSVLNGNVDDGYGGLLGWMWAVSAVMTISLLGVTWLALRERYYSAVMAATGLLYLAILTAFGTDVMARAAFGA